MPIGLTFVVLGIALSYGMDVLDTIGSDFRELDETVLNDTWNNQSASYNSTQFGLNAVTGITSKTSLIVTVIVAAVIIGILITYMVVRMKG